MRICILSAGAGGMYCGSCLRDNALASALLRGGHRVALVPLYSPVRTDSPGVAIDEVFLGGINAYLQYASVIFRYTPRAVDWLFDRPWLLNLAGSYGAQTSPAKLGPFILSILEGEEGPQIKEIRRLARFIADELKPEVISLPNLMLIGLARLLRRETGAPIVCELTGEDIFLEAMAEPYRSQAKEIIRQRTRDVDQLVATSAYYAERMAEYLAVERSKITVVYPGVSREQIEAAPAVAGANRRPPTIGFLARICPEKGLHGLVEALGLLRQMPGLGQARVRAAGYLGPAHRAWYESLRERIGREGLAEVFTYAGEVDLAGKLAFFDSIDLLCVPTTFQEPKGMYILEAFARGVPVVQPNHGAFPELISLSEAGVLVPPGDAQALAIALGELLNDPGRRAQLGARGRGAVAARFTDDHMAAEMLRVYEGVQAASA